MVSIEAHFTGSQIARALQSDHEELAYFLDELSEEFDGDDAQSVLEKLPYGKAEQVAAFLRVLADTFDPET